ncbi:DUF3558 domain-containing protein [Saccharomonospora sp. CUA-673]|uniref:DUF3558 domain-containing protein n=1 Tax=Saccharomonospora sp. CUA-673 TaxID=1904969 RepID=UPI001C9E288F|nr:DUF3558 domain-containing protein [Saccharomonospora sp. CUA-673]
MGGVALLAVGCGGETDGQPAPAPASPETSASAPASGDDGLPHSGAPAVTNPLPESVLSGHPCDEALTEDQAKELLGDAVQSKHEDMPEIGPGCNWSSPDSGAAFLLNYDTASHEGLSDSYKNAQSQVEIFNEIEPVGGFPAIEYKRSQDDHTCTTIVGLADEYGLVLTLTIGTQGEEQGDDPCDGGRIVLEEVVDNLKAKA